MKTKQIIPCVTLILIFLISSSEYAVSDTTNEDFKMEYFPADNYAEDVIETQSMFYLNGDNAFFCAPLYKLKKDTMDVWLKKIDDFVIEGEITCYAEGALNELSDKLCCQAFYYEEFCMEIDSFNDLEIALKFLRR